MAKRIQDRRLQPGRHAAGGGLRTGAAIAATASFIFGAAGIVVPAIQLDRPTVVDLLERYDRGDHDGAVSAFRNAQDARALARQLDRSAELWAARPGSPDTVERRRLVAAVFALELASLRRDTYFDFLREAIEKACARLRQGRTTAAERLWHLAVVAIASGAKDKALILGEAPSWAREVVSGGSRYFAHADHAARRFPDEARFRFAEAVVADFPGLVEPNRDAPSVVNAIAKERGLRSIQALKPFLDDPAVGAEAHLRTGHLYYCLANPRTAASHFQTALQRSHDPYIQYLSHFFVGRMFETSGRRVDAATAYRNALSVLPQTQSATMALAATLFLDQKPNEAYELLDASFTAQHRPVDPWRVFAHGDHRFLPQLVAELRAHIRP